MAWLTTSSLVYRGSSGCSSSLATRPTYKGRAVDVKQVGRELGVRYVLEGSVRKAADRVRVTGQLINAETGAHVWAERYDRKADDIFALQDDITLSVVGAIEPSVRLAEIERVKRKRSDNLDAYDLVVQAQPDVYSRVPERCAKALLLLERALALDPTYPFGTRLCRRMPPQHFFAWRTARTASHRVDPSCRICHSIWSRRCFGARVCRVCNWHGQA